MTDDKSDRRKLSQPREDEIHIPEEELERVVSAMMKSLELGICVVYGDEDEDVPDAVVDCGSRLDQCRSLCCSFQFALTKQEVQRGHIRYDARRPFFIAHDADSYCHHLDRETLKCSVWKDRPLRCRKYDCTDDPQVRPEKRPE